MKKVTGLLLVGLLLTASPVLADGISMIGKKVTAETALMLDGKQMNNAIIINNTSYAPVREIAEALSVDVTFNKSEGGTVVALNSDTENKIKLKVKVKGLQKEIERLIQGVSHLNEKIEIEPKGDLATWYQSELIASQKRLVEAQAELITLTVDYIEK